MTDLPTRVTVEDDRVILRGRLGGDVVLDIAYPDTPGRDEFLELFEHVKNESGHWLSAEDYYQVISVMTVIRRKADGRLFGYPWSTEVADHSESYWEPNGDSHGFDEYDDALCLDGGDEDEDDNLNDVFVWLPVEPFTITGYRLAGGAE